MGSVGNQNPWTPYNTYRDCSQGICSIYCPQWCYIIFPPPPPFGLGEDDSGTDFSPLIIAIIGILASAFILVSYYTIISKYCRRRGGQGDGSTEMNGMENEAWHGGGSPGGLEEALIKSITVCKYKKGDGFIEGTDCSVCLSEFQENENLRLLPKCNHAFHLPCIDTWLKSHASCPLCRANIAPLHIPPAGQTQAQAQAQAQVPPPIQDPPRSTTVSTLEYQHRFNDAILVIQDLEGTVREESVLSISVVGDDLPKTAEEGMHGAEAGNNSVQPIRRSVSMNFSSNQNQVSISDILRISEDGIADQLTREREKNHSGGIFNLVPSSAAMKKSASTGRFMFPRHEKGWGSVNPDPV